MEVERFDNFYRWKPKGNQCDTNKAPLYYIVSLFDKHYFINNSQELIPAVKTSRSISILKRAKKISNSIQVCSYQNVKPKEAILIHKDIFIEEHTMIWEVVVNLSSKTLYFNFEPCMGLRENILMWETFTTPAGVRLKIIEN